MYEGDLSDDIRKEMEGQGWTINTVEEQGYRHSYSLDGPGADDFGIDGDTDEEDGFDYGDDYPADDDSEGDL